MPSDQVSVIIPTLAERSRFGSIRRCIASIRLASNNRSKIIIVVNGSRSDPEVLGWLEQQVEAKIIKVAMPSAPNAVRIGRKAVDTPFFSTVDDDDEYLPGSTDRKLQTLIENPDSDFVIANGLKSANGINELVYSNLSRVPGAPLEALFDANWLASCNALFRSKRIPPKFFDDFHPYAEWTWLAFKLALSKKQIAVLDEPCFRCNYTPQSLSQSTAYRDAYPSLFERMLESSPPANIKRLIKRRLSAALHDRSAALLQEGDRLAALSAHLDSLLLPGGLRYLAYTRRLIPGWPQL